ncbi:11-beta-hydroxysteroid dehydrogenase-like 2 [Cardamine amara subsp. amara]|uniref:11-beta-hydroxysteroid dehydrogenase-like 2 n=1 Tax=Cardamine amara subsp. amara TaxID=228776 RepID=A0ABD1BY54_CARAN
MDTLHSILNLLLPPLTIIFLFLFYPFYLLIKLVIFLHKHLHFENLSGKVILITGASSGIGEHIAYEYAKKGAYLALVARRKDRLEIVAETSRQLGSGDVIIIPGDAANVEDCKKFIDETIHHFGKLDHLINNAGVSQAILFEDFTQIQDAKPIIDINFWGSTYTTYFAIPHLRKSKGRIIVITSSTANLPLPTESVYSASKAALLRLYETLRVELSPEIKITIAFPGYISTDMTTPNFIEKYGSDLFLSESVSRCAKAIFKGIGRGETYITEPYWMKFIYLIKIACPEIFDYVLNYLFFRYGKPYFKRD